MSAVQGSGTWAISAAHAQPIRHMSYSNKGPLKPVVCKGRVKSEREIYMLLCNRLVSHLTTRNMEMKRREENNSYHKRSVE